MKLSRNHAAILTFALPLLGAAADTTSRLPKEAIPETPWDDLKAVLSSPETLTPGTVTEWKEQCVNIFQDVAETPGVGVSNYQLLNQSSGLCLDHVSCAYEKCMWPKASDSWPMFTAGANPTVISPDMALDDSDMEQGKILLPAMVLQPKSAADIVRAVEFCKENNIGITVKVAGHSYFGASTAKNTLLIKMNPNYSKYAIGGSLTECDNLEIGNATIPTATETACAVAASRNKVAVLRVGGGELFDEAYRSVSFDWNQANPDRKYHLVGGGAGTVSAAGGWMASGGLSGTTGMRMYGIGIDQVVALEMVLPTGQHVRFAPTEWTEVEVDGYPQTTSVTGHCNAAPYELDERLWEWTECEDDIDFNELWFAVRGGGGGTYGIVVSLHYQLHEYPGPLNGVLSYVDPEALTTPREEVPPEGLFLLHAKYAEFLLSYLWQPEALNVSQADSRACNSAMSITFNPFCGGLLYCYGSAGATFVQAWKDFITEPAMLQAFEEAGIPDDWLGALTNLMNNETFYDSFAAQVLEAGAADEGIPEGRLADGPKAALVPMLGGFPNLADSTHTHFPLDAILADIPGMAQLLASDLLSTDSCGIIYAMGGMVPNADDGLNSLSATRRQAAFLMAVGSAEFRDTYFGLSYGGLDPSTDNFPGSSCHNHALVHEMGPVKTNWSQSCPLDWPQAEREEKCISQNEAAWGTVNLERLNAFKAAIDPDSLFICTSGVGYSNPAPKASSGGENPPPMEESGEASTDEEVERGATAGSGGDAEEGDSTEATADQEAPEDKAAGSDPTSATNRVEMWVASCIILSSFAWSVLAGTH